MSNKRKKAKERKKKRKLFILDILFCTAKAAADFWRIDATESDSMNMKTLLGKRRLPVHPAPERGWVRGAVEMAALIGTNTP